MITATPLFPMTMDAESTQLLQIAQEILRATRELDDADGFADEASLPSATDLARSLNLKIDKVKKRIRQLVHDNVIRPVSFSPKRYRFDLYALRHLPEDSLYRLLD
jgi:DNA-binding Lrp family transcriptional regulator